MSEKKNKATGPATLEEANEIIHALKQELKAKDDEVNDLQGMVRDLNNTNRALEATKGNPLPIGTCSDGTQVQLMVAKAVLKGKGEMSAAAIAGDPALCQRLKDMNSGVVKAISA